MFQSQTYGKLHIKQIPDKLLMFFEKYRKFDTPIHIIVGTDSQNFSQTKMVSVIAVTCEGHGGIFFYEVTRQPRIMDVRTKLHVETNDSLRIASTLVEQMENEKKYEEMYLNCPISIHVDAGNSKNGKTKELIPELVGWVRAMGYECEIKPDSYVASTIADRISK
ncbi:MAG: ribonuclease H-like YkuK family protein [Lachnospiraceae bacterium]|nr:ribonuclease H-like YkuK family protein [Lachnospiraceae bacterium]